MLFWFDIIDNQKSYYLNQKRAAWNASVESDVRNDALAITTKDFKRRW